MPAGAGQGSARVLAPGEGRKNIDQRAGRQRREIVGLDAVDQEGRYLNNSCQPRPGRQFGPQLFDRRRVDGDHIRPGSPAGSSPETNCGHAERAYSALPTDGSSDDGAEPPLDGAANPSDAGGGTAVGGSSGFSVSGGGVAGVW
jgi:hypothetical protein